MGERGRSVDESGDGDETSGSRCEVSRRHMLQQSVIGSLGFGIASSSISETAAAEPPSERSSSILASGGVAEGLTLYVGCSGGNVYAVDAESGNEQWRFETGDAVWSSPTVVNGTVYIGSYDGNVYALDAADGTKQWEYHVGGTVRSSPTVVNGTLYVGSDDGTVFAIDTTSETPEWTFSEPTGAVDTAPAVVDGMVYVGCADARVYAVDAESGDEQWRFETGDAVHCSPTVTNGTVYVGAENEGTLWALEAQTGAIDWSFSGPDNDVRSSPTVVDGTVYVGSDGPSYQGHSLWAIDAETGDLRWEFTEPDLYGVTSSPTVLEGTVYVGEWDTVMYAVDAASGTKEWAYTNPAQEVVSSPTGLDQTIYVGEADGYLSALDAESGERQWQFDAAGPVRSSPTIVGDPESGHSIGTRVMLGTLGHHHEWADESVGGPGKPSAEITVSPSSPTVDEDVEFEGLLDGEDADSFEWRLGDGETADSQTVTHTYGSAGTYMVELEAVYGGTTYTADIELEVTGNITVEEVEPPAIKTTAGEEFTATVVFRAPGTRLIDFDVDETTEFGGNTTNFSPSPDADDISKDTDGDLRIITLTYDESTPPDAWREINLGITYDGTGDYSETWDWTWHTFARHVSKTGPLAVEDDGFYVGSVFKAPGLDADDISNDISVVKNSQFIEPGNTTAVGSPAPSVTVVNGSSMDDLPIPITDDLEGIESIYGVIVSYDSPSIGEGIELDVAIEADGTEVFRDFRKIFAFESVEPIDVIPTKVANRNGNNEGAALFKDLREKAERVNEYFASNLGTMGQEGRDFRFPTRGTDNSKESGDHVTLDNGWLELPLKQDRYEARDQDPNITDIGNPYNLQDLPDDAEENDLDSFSGLVPATHAIQLVYRSTEIQLSENKTTAQIVMAKEPFGEYHHGGDGWTGSIGVPSDMNKEFKYHIYVPESGADWIHEVGHNLGLPDLYKGAGYTDTEPWGLMSHEAPGQITAYCRAVNKFGDRVESNWLAGAEVESVLRDEPVNLDLDFLAEMSHTDTLKYIRSGYRGAHEDYYIAEARQSDDSGIDHPDSNVGDVSYSPASRDGVALYYAGNEDIQSHGRNGHLAFLTDQQNKFKPTLHNANDEATFAPIAHSSGTTFKLEKLDSGGARLRAEAEPGATFASKLAEQTIENTLTVHISTDSEWLAEYQEVGDGHTPSEGPLPSLDIMVKTSDGERAGTDSENESFIREIDGSYVTKAGRERRVLVPLRDDLEVIISGERLLTALQERGHHVDADEVPITQEVFVETDPKIVETDDGFLQMKGRTQRTTAHTLNESTRETIVPATIDINPDHLNTKSNGKFITAYIGLPETGDPGRINLSTVQLGDVSAVTDKQYGFTPDPPVETHGGEEMAMVKFRRQAVIDTFEPGIHEVPITGVAEDQMFLGTAELDLFESGNSNGNGNDNKGNGNSGNGNGGNGNGKGGNGNGNGQGN